MRRIPDDNLAYPVLINLDSISTGTGFFVNSSKAIYLVTAKHVLFDMVNDKLHHGSCEVTSYSREGSYQEKNVLRLNLDALLANGDIKRDGGRDVAIIRMGYFSDNLNIFQTQPSIESIQAASAGITGVGLENIKSYSDVLISNEVFIFGYPISLGVPQIPQIDYSKPLLRAGIVAGRNDMFQSLVLDCPVYPGNSGGPVVEVEQDGLNVKFKVIGLVIQFVPAVAQMTGPLSGNVSINSGYSVAASMDIVIKIINDFEIA